MGSPFLERWLEEALATPGATGLDDLASARRVLLDDALRATPVLERCGGDVVDVGAGSGSPGIPLAVAHPNRAFTLLEAQRRKCDFLVRVTSELPNVTVVWGRAEEQPPGTFGVALAKALAKPPVAVELCLPLVEVGGVAVLWIGRSADTGAMSEVAAMLGGRLEEHAAGLAIVRKVTETPNGFPRRPGIAKKRPLA